MLGTIGYILIFFAGSLVGILTIAFLIAANKNNKWLDYWQGYIEGYSKAKEDIENDSYEELKL